MTRGKLRVFLSILSFRLFHKVGNGYFIKAVAKEKVKMRDVFVRFLAFLLIGTTFRIADSHHGSSHVVAYLRDSREHARRKLTQDHDLHYVSEVCHSTSN